MRLGTARAARVLVLLPAAAYAVAGAALLARVLPLSLAPPLLMTLPSAVSLVRFVGDNHDKPEVMRGGERGLTDDVID